MDLRVEKTRRSIINAFLQLRARKPLEKITVKELSELAEINKATFYLHYHDIYHLSEKLEEEVVESALNNIEHPDCIFSDTQLFTEELGKAIHSNEQMIKIICEGSRSTRFVKIFETKIRAMITALRPDFEHSPMSDMALTFILYGSYYLYDRFRDEKDERVFDTIGRLSSAVINVISDSR